MNSTTQSIRSLLYIDFGSVNTRVCLFDRNNGLFTFVGAATCTAHPHDSANSILANMAEAIQKLEKASHRKILDINQNIVIPMKLDGSGIDQVAVSFTCVPDPRIALLGVTREGSLRNLRNLLQKAGMTSTLEISAEEGRKVTEQLDLLLTTAPRIVMVAGGTEHGSVKTVYRLGEMLMLACKSLPEEQRPEILFLGNSDAKLQMDRVFSKLTDISFGTNILNNGTGYHAAVNSLIYVLRKDAEKRIPELKQLREKTGATAVPGEFAFGRSIRLMSRLVRQNHHVMGVDVGASKTVIADAVNLQLRLETLPYGVGSRMGQTLQIASAAEIQRWIGFQIKTSEVQDYLMNKNVYPDLIPANRYSAEIELAATREILRYSAAQPGFRETLQAGTLSTILLSGAILRNVDDPGTALLAAMDGLSPVGMVDYLLDMNGLATAIGALAHQNAQFVSQILNVSTYLNLGKVVRPAQCRDHTEKSVIKISLRDETGKVRKYDIPHGMIFRIPLDYGKNYELDWLSVPRGMQIPGVKTWSSTGFKSGCFGLVFDRRAQNSSGIALPSDRSAQLKAIEAWRKQLGPWREEQQEEVSE